MRKVASAVLTAGVSVGLFGVAPASAQDDNTAFCETVLETEAVIAQEAFDELDPLLTQLETSAPPDIAPTVQTLVAQTRAAIENETDPSQDPAYVEAEAATGDYLYESCGWQTADVTMSEYEFSGLPKSFTTGPAIIKIANEGAEVHEFVPLRIKNKKDSLRKIIGLSESKAQRKIEVLGHDLAQPGGSTFAVLNFERPGKYGAVCFIPVGSTPEVFAASEGGGEEGEEHGGGGEETGPPHALEGMYSAFKVTRA